MHSALYEGWLDHRRLQPRRHAFRHRLYMVYLDLAELPGVFRGRWLWSATRPALARFERRDHLGDPALPLDECVRRLVAERSGRRPQGPIRLLTQLRCFGYGFNPVSFFYCFDAADERVETIVAEVTNTPWGERHCYVLPMAAQGSGLQASSSKALHVSPFHPMALRYDWRFTPPGAALTVHMSLRAEASADTTAAASAAEPAAPPLFGATLALRKRPLAAGAMAWMLLRYPAMALQVIAAIHWQALRLWLKRVPVFDHPKHAAAAAAAAGLAAADPNLQEPHR